MANITYRQVNDYMIPNLTLPPEESAICLGKMGYDAQELLAKIQPRPLRNTPDPRQTLPTLRRD